MEPSSMVLAGVLLGQMGLILIMLNPLCDIRVIFKYLNAVYSYKSWYYFFVVTYFVTVLYWGMFIPLHNIHKLIFGTFRNTHDKLLLLRQVEKSYLMAGFSLFLMIVLYGLRAMVSYSACLLEQSKRLHRGLIPLQPLAAVPSNLRKLDNRLEPDASSINILANLLKVKRSMSYETLILGNKFDELRKVFRNPEKLTKKT